MHLLFECAKLVLPDGFVLPEDRAAFEQELLKLADMRFGEFFNLDVWLNPTIAPNFPNLKRERLEDLQDNDDFFWDKNRRFFIADALNQSRQLRRP